MMDFFGQYCGSGSGIRLHFDPWIRDPVWVTYQDPDPGSRSWMNNPDHNSETFKNLFFWVKYLSSLMWFRDPVSGMEKFGSGIRDEKKSDPK
jgi:hypothetical protein